MQSETHIFQPYLSYSMPKNQEKINPKFFVFRIFHKYLWHDSFFSVIITAGK